MALFRFTKCLADYSGYIGKTDLAIEESCYGNFVGCIEGNKWSWPGSERLFIELPNDDIEALREKSAPDLEERAGEGAP